MKKSPFTEIWVGQFYLLPQKDLINIHRMISKLDFISTVFVNNSVEGVSQNRFKIIHIFGKSIQKPIITILYFNLHFQLLTFCRRLRLKALRWCPLQMRIIMKEGTKKDQWEIEGKGREGRKGCSSVVCGDLGCFYPSV